MSLAPEEWVEAFLDRRLAVGLSRSTLSLDQRALMSLAAWMRTRGLDLRDLTPSRMLAYLEQRRQRLADSPGTRSRQVSAATVQVELRTLHVWFRYLVEQDVLLLDPVRELHGKLDRRICGRGIFTECEVERILDSLDTDDRIGLRDRALIGVLYGAGLRLGEVVALDVADYSPEERILWVRAGKGGKGRVVPLGRRTARDVMAYLERGRIQLAPVTGCAALFVGRAGRRLTCEAIDKRVRTLQARIGISPVRGAHAFRHAFATHLLAHGADVRHLQRLLGHASPATTMVYTHVELGELRRALLRAHPRERGFA